MVKRKRIKRIFGQNFHLIIGLLFIGLFLVYRYHEARILSFNVKEVQKYQTNNIKPEYIKSYPLGIDVDIKEALINNGVWVINPKSANYLLNSAGIGDGGNIIIYGHNNDNILGPIRHIKLGTIVEITGSDNKIYKYEVTKTDIVDPSNLYYIQEKNEEILTIYTCIGFLDSKRYIVVAKRV